MSKKVIELTVTMDDGQERKYTGRFLGFIKDDEFNALAQEKKVAGKIESKETKDIVEICKSNDELTGMRLVMTVKKINGVTVVNKKLFVSEKLNLISQVAGKEITFLLDGGNSMVAEDKG